VLEVQVVIKEMCYVKDVVNRNINDLLF